ncbi:hypothetical protein ADIS_3908 [Lunatimonas lonarensis]|uniref:Uncharacterized protein n=1 Tax=Lunatimonas lonarensis TaxID=1232681 RepID=R7ZN25_9BACT|nr:hypothetical protein [Lunatimonas lonarensis]EON75505.1 hypothetical protein ADIS_3908 [Lunatimonas lonarensis]
MNRRILGNLLLVFGILILFGCGGSDQLSEQASVSSLEISDTKENATYIFMTNKA